jgi:hypothetical protein
MHRSQLVVGATLWLACTIGSMVVARPCESQVRINEILADPVADWDGDGTLSFKNDEWVEVVNVGPVPANLDGLRLSDAGSGITFRFGFTGLLGPGAHRLVYGSQSVAWELANGWATAGLSLNNAGDTVRLWTVTESDTLLMDSYAYTTASTLKDRSVGRMPDGGETWFVFDSLNPYSGTTAPLGTGCHPTPAMGNGCPTAVLPSTWSAVKRLYD